MIDLLVIAGASCDDDAERWRAAVDALVGWVTRWSGNHVHLHESAHSEGSGGGRRARRDTEMVTETAITTAPSGVTTVSRSRKARPSRRFAGRSWPPRTIWPGAFAGVDQRFALLQRLTQETRTMALLMAGTVAAVGALAIALAGLA